jgi:hypothetical protein
MKTIIVFSILKTQRGDSFRSESIVTYESSFLIGKPIRGLQYVFWQQDFCSIIATFGYSFIKLWLENAGGDFSSIIWLGKISQHYFLTKV